ncbi:unnamed protein product [Zymoseptoria tritici ST99CH_1E4]|uniref:Secreted protein n=1 Tax=Zymoseptoria tritici ST99CH_1E4 TaxID=1276532 RepID=A0A2H1G615_ZYMTR|nr:unnamed protein product [Zymoseptoria tritici ST99CH_1E4]
MQLHPIAIMLTLATSALGYWVSNPISSSRDVSSLLTCCRSVKAETASAKESIMALTLALRAPAAVLASLIPLARPARLCGMGSTGRCAHNEKGSAMARSIFIPPSPESGSRSIWTNQYLSHGDLASSTPHRLSLA